MSKWVKRLTSAACVLFMGVGLAMAAEDTDITVTKADFGDKYFKEVVWFDAFDVGGAGTGTYYFNDQSGSSTADGLVEARKYELAKTVQIRPLTVASTSIDVQIQGRAGTDTNWGEIVTKNFTTGTSTDYIVSVVEFLDELRVGVRANGTAGTDSVTVTGILLGGGR